MSTEKQYSERLRKFSRAASELTYSEMMEFAFQVYVRLPIDWNGDVTVTENCPHTVAEAIIKSAHQIQNSQVI